MSKHQPLTEAEREQRRAEDRERLKQAAEQLLSSGGLAALGQSPRQQRPGYSLTNQLLVALQSGGRATFVAGFKQWLAVGYCVKRGERAIRIMAKRALLHLMRPDPIAVSVLLGRAVGGRALASTTNSSGVCGVGMAARLLVSVCCVTVASDAKRDRPVCRW
jgi:hypothetical protein